MARKPAKDINRKSGSTPKKLSIPCVEVIQGKHRLYTFKYRASELWEIVSINRRSEDKDEGYQRALSSSRVNSVARHILDGKPIPTSLLVSFEKAKYDAEKQELSIPKGTDVGWIIDGQHRLAGAHEASKKGTEIEFAVCAIIGASGEFQIEQFITINREAKGVPSSLVYDLLKKLPVAKSLTDVANDRAAELAERLRLDPDSVFSGRIVVTTSPKSGQISLTNFVRKISPLVHRERGLLSNQPFENQLLIIENYFRALKRIYPNQWKVFGENIFFKTLGFGAMINVFDLVWKETRDRFPSSFRVVDITKILSEVDDFDFAQWDGLGSGNKAEMQAAMDFKIDLERGLEHSASENRLKL